MLATTVDAAHATVDFHAESAYYRHAARSSDDYGQISDIIARARVGRTTLSLTDLAAEPYLEPAEQHARKQEHTAQKHLKAAHAAKARVQELKTDARTEGHPVSAASEEDLLAFLDDHVFTHRPFITLLDNGNLRALWKNDADEQIGIQFRGEKQVQYVLFARREGQDYMARVSGRDNVANIGRQIDALTLGRLMTA